MSLTGQPNTFLIGAFKCATSTIADHLSAHPDVFLSTPKEPHYFSFSQPRQSFNGSGDQAAIATMVLEDDQYRQLFAAQRDVRILVDASASYLPSKIAAQRIHREVPGAKMIAVLRQPAERAFSSYLHLRRDGRETIKDFRKALDKETSRIQENYAWLWRYQAMGKYGEQLAYWMQLFDKSRFHVVLYDDFIKHPAKTIKEIFSFLDVQSYESTEETKRLNVSGVPRNRFVHNFLHQKSFLRSVIGPLVPASLRRRVRKGNMTKPTIDPKIKQELTLAFKSDIVLLEEMIGRELSHWYSEYL